MLGDTSTRGRQRDKRSSGLWNAASSSNFVARISITIAWASSATLIGRSAKATNARIRLSRTILSSFSVLRRRSILSYVSSRVIGRDLSASLMILGLFKGRIASIWHFTHRNLPAKVSSFLRMDARKLSLTLRLQSRCFELDLSTPQADGANEYRFEEQS